MGRLRERLHQRNLRKGNNRRTIGWRLALVNTLFWSAIFGASGFNYEFMWIAGLFIAIPWIFIGKGGKQIEENAQEYFEEAKKIENNASIPAPVENKELHIKILDEAEQFIEQIKSASSVASGNLGQSLRSMVVSIDKVRIDLLKQPEKISNVQRLFTYYIPETANLLSARGKAASANDSVRISEIDEMLAKLEIAFSQFNSKLEIDDTRAAQIDLKLLSQSLEQDFGKIESKVK